MSPMSGSAGGVKTGRFIAFTVLIVFFIGVDSNLFYSIKDARTVFVFHVKRVIHVTLFKTQYCNHV